MFEQFGLLCRHIFCTFRFYKINEIPIQYAIRRWKRGIIPANMLNRSFRYGDKDDAIHVSAMEVFSSVEYVLAAISKDKSKVDEYVACIKEVENRFMNVESPIIQEVSKAQEFDNLLGITRDDDVVIENSLPCQNKGRKRLRSGKEISMEKKKKEPRKCALCGKIASHDKRNCPTKKKPANKKL